MLKRRYLSQTPGAWAGTIIHIAGGTVSMSVSQERWDKGRTIVTRLSEEIMQSETLPFKALEGHRDFLMYLS